MVSIHIVPVIVYLIIKVISSTFRFKREALHCRSLHTLRLLEMPCLSKRATQKPHACMYNNPPIPMFAVGVWIHQWLYRYLRYVYNTPMGHSPLLCY